MKKDKYYTPSIEEFNIGFEYEVNNIMGDGCWYKFSFNETDSMRNIQDYCNEGIYRVKYLDENDLQSLGFEIHDYDNMDSFTNGDIDIEINGYVEEDIIEIWSRKTMLDNTPEMVFKGTIKNKSELKRILTQIGYELPN